MAVLLTMFRHEAIFIQSIVEDVQDKLRRKILSMPSNPIGITSRAEFIHSWLKSRSSDVGMLAICGLPGLGKTTIAKYVYNLNWSRFQDSSFLADIAEVLKQPNGLISLQRQLLADIIKGRGERINSAHEGRNKVQDALKHRCVLLVLDDVGTQEQIEEIVGICDWFHAGSKIIITTKDEHVAQAHKVCTVYKLPILNPKESLELFSWHAFGPNKPDECFKETSKRFAYHCGGLPLAIKIVGSSLLGKCLSVWESQLKKLIAVPNGKILQKLKISFDLLDYEDKELFLDIACFFVGYDKDYVVPILDGCGLYTIVGFQNLIDKCLLTIKREFSCQARKRYGLTKDKLEMHSLVQQMGREIVREESPKEPGNRSRIWDNNDSLHILREKSGTIKIEGLILNMQKSKNSTFGGHTKRQFQQAFDKSILYNLENSIKRYCYGNWYRRSSTTTRNSCETAFEIETFAMMCNIKFLVLNYVQLSGDYKHFPVRLKWLCWHGFPLQSIPSDFCLNELVILEMPYSSLKRVWIGAKNLNCLKVLNLSDSYNITKTPDFSLVLNLEKLILENCTSLVEIHESIRLLHKLVLLNLRNCAKLSKFPRSIGGLKLLMLDISGCTNLEEWPRWLENMESLAVLQADRVGKVKTQYSSIWRWSLKPNKNFRISFTYLPSSLVHLSLVACNLRDDAFPTDASKLSSLKDLDLSNNPIGSFPDCFACLTGLEYLTLSSCTELRSITKLQIKSLRVFNVGECLLLEKVTSLLLPTNDFMINYNGCESLVELFNHFNVEPIENADKEIVKDLGLSNWESLGITNIRIYQYRTGKRLKQSFQGFTIFRRRAFLHGLPDYDDIEFNIFTTYFPGSEVPVWCNFKRKGNSIHLNVPFYDDSIRIQGLNVCYVYAFLDYPEGIGLFNPYTPLTRVENERTGMVWENRDRWFTGFAKTNQDMIDLSYWKFNDGELKSGDILDIQVHCRRCDIINVKEIGVRILFQEQKEKSHLEKKTKESNLLAINRIRNIYL